jgi:transporter family-2 protein
MIAAALMATLAGVLIGLSRQINGRLALTRGALGASFWNHLVGAAALLAAAMALWGTAARPDLSGLGSVPSWAWAGGPLGVLFVAAGSWLVARLGAARTALLVIAGQMTSGAILDSLRLGWDGTPLRALGVAAILAGVVLAAER